MEVVFVIGAPRSGTTVLQNILNCHSKIVAWYEPYYLWREYFRDRGNEIWSANDLNEKSLFKIRQEFQRYANKAQKPIVLDKSPGHVFNLKIIQAIFPKAKWIHIIRDGRDVTLSINKEWIKRKEIVVQRDFKNLFRITKNMIERQPFWKYKLMAIFYEIKSNFSVNPLHYLNKSKWAGRPGWGPRFEGWQGYLQEHSTLEFNAMQWVKCLEAVKESWDCLPATHKIEIRYEDILRSPEESLAKILNSLGLEPPINFFKKIPQLKTNNFDKWAQEFTAEEIDEIKPILAPLINDLGYAHPGKW
jgi:LPS sulfotransferase NodH